jgi:hypothetical protein
MMKVDEIAGVSLRTGDAGYFSLLYACNLKILPAKEKQGSKSSGIYSKKSIPPAYDLS